MALNVVGGKFESSEFANKLRGENGCMIGTAVQCCNAGNVDIQVDAFVDVVGTSQDKPQFR